MNDWYTVNQAADETNIPAETVRRYIRQYGDYLMLKKGDKRAYLINESSLDTVKKIRFLLDQGNQRIQVEDILQQTETLTIHMNDDDMNEYLMTLPQLNREMSKQLKTLSEQSKQQTEMIEDLTRRLDQYQNKFDERLIKHDELLMETLRESLETKKLIAASEEKKGLFGFFRRLFKGKR